MGTFFDAGGQNELLKAAAKYIIDSDLRENVWVNLRYFDGVDRKFWTFGDGENCRHFLDLTEL